MTKYAFQNKA